MTFSTWSLSLSSSSSCCSLWLALSLTILFLVNAVTAQEYDCLVGCSLDASISGPPVCGEDNLTYINECLAVCQNVVVLHYGSCEGGGLAESASAMSTDTEIITLETMTRFISRGYRFISKTTQFSNGPEDESLYASSFEAASVAEEVVEEMEPYSVLFTPEGYEYAYKGDSITAPTYEGPTTPYYGVESIRRQLAIIGADTRTAIVDTKAFPYRTIGEADFGNSQGGCTLTMISRNAALTAGHCVYNIRSKTPINMSRIAPGRFRDSSGRTIAPYGTWDVDTMQTFGEFKSSGNILFDIAVVTFKPKTGTDGCQYVYPGDVVGFVAIDRPRISNNRVSDSRLDTSTITGYPADYPDGVMATSGICSKPWTSDNAQFAFHFCDTFGGNSGSAVLTSTNIALGDHAYGFYDENNVGISNGAVMMSGRLFDSIYEWAGLGQEQEVCGSITGPEPSDSCSCRKLDNRPFFQLICFIFNRKQCFGV